MRAGVMHAQHLMQNQTFLVTTTLTAAVVAFAPNISFWALKTAAGGGGSGQNGFASFASFLDNIGTYLVYVGAAGGVIGLVGSGMMLMTGSPQANGLLGKVVIGIGVCLLAKGIFA